MKIRSAILLTSLVMGAANAASILLVTNDPEDGSAADQVAPLHNFLTTSGHTVTRDAGLTGPAAASASTFDLVIVTRETNSGNYDEGTEPQDWNSLAVPMINLAPHLMRSNRWGWSTNTSLPLTGAVTDWDSGTSFSTAANAFNVIGNALVAGATINETIGSNPSAFFIPSGTTFANSRGTAGADRYGLIIGAEGAWANATPEAEALLLSTINTAVVPEPSTAMLGLLSMGAVMLRRRR